MRPLGLMRLPMTTVGRSQLIFMLLDLLESSAVRLIAVIASFDQDDHFHLAWGLISGCQEKLSLKILPITSVSVLRMSGMD